MADTMRRRVVITGLGLATPLGLDVEESWRKALAGINGIGRIDLPNAEKSPVQAAGQISAPDWDRICREFPAEARSEGERRTLFALWAARKALADAKWREDGRDCSRCGAVLASGLGINRLEDIHSWLDDKKFDSDWFASEYVQVHRESIIRNNSSRPAALIAEKFGLGGINATVTTACASSTQAIGTAFRAIARGEADLMVTGGTDSMLNPVGLIFFVLLGSAAVSRMEPGLLCRPFDRKRSGLVMGEGAGMAVLEEEEHARRRGAKIYAEVAGYGSSMDAYRLTAPQPEGRGAAESMRRALADAGMAPDGVDYINAHGTSTKLNDIAETLAVREVFGEYADGLAISSSKSLIGHLLAASGGPEFIFTTLSVQRDAIHPTLNLTNPDPKCDLDYVPNVKREKTVRAALSNSFGFGGQNATIAVKKYTG